MFIFLTVYEKLKANNNALARALSKEKQDHQYTFSHSLALTSQIQDMQVAINKRDEILSKILQNSKQGLELLVKATGFLTDTIQSCRTIVQTDPINMRTNLSRSPMPRRDSSRQSIKSPARGVVQPMVSGHTITKPVINLSRINMPRIRTSPNLSDIEESISTPERSSLRIDNNASPVETTATNTSSTATSFVRLPANQQNGFPTRRVERLLPERIRRSTARISDEVDDLPESNSNRRSKSRRTSRYSRRESRNSERLSVNHEPRFNHESLPEMFKSPRVALQDVSRFLRNNAQTVNVNTIFENDNTSGNSNSMEVSTIVEPTNDQNISEQNDESSENIIDKLSESWTAPTYGFDSRKNDLKKSSKADDPLEGSSWMHTSDSFVIDEDNSNNQSTLQASNSLNGNSSATFTIPSETPGSLEMADQTNADQTVAEEDPNDSSRIEWAENRCTISSTSSDSEEDSNDDADNIKYSKFFSVNTRNRKMNNYVSDDDNNHDKSKNGSKYSSTGEESPKSRKFSTQHNNDESNENEEVDDDDDGEKCGNWGRLAASINTRTRRTDDNEVNNDNNNLLRISSNVTTERGRQPIDSDDDFTMIIKKKPCPTRNLPFDINELNLPVLERPLVETPQVDPEPEFTTEINMITRVINSPMPRRTIRESLIDNSTVLIPQINETLNRTSTGMDRLDNTTMRTSGDSFIGHPDILKRKRINKHRLISSSDSEPSSPLETVSKSKRKSTKKKDPSTAKVVLQKLEESRKILSITSRTSSNSFS